MIAHHDQDQDPTGTAVAEEPTAEPTRDLEVEIVEEEGAAGPALGEAADGEHGGVRARA